MKGGDLMNVSDEKCSTYGVVLEFHLIVGTARRIGSESSSEWTFCTLCRTTVHSRRPSKHSCPVSVKDDSWYLVVTSEAHSAVSTLTQRAAQDIVTALPSCAR